MSCQSSVGSLDSWLPALSCVVQSSGLASKTRPQSPFAAISSTALCHSLSEPVPIRSSACPAAWPAVSSDAAGGDARALRRRDSSFGSLQTTCQSAEAGHMSLSDALRVFDEAERSTLPAQADQLRGCCGDLEDTVRHGRRKLASSPQRCAAKSKPIGVHSGSAMSPAASLPAQATQAPVSLASLCTALSTPPSVASLASDHRPMTSSCAVSAAACTAVFTRSMAWSPEALTRSSRNPSCCSLAVLPEYEADQTDQEVPRPTCCDAATCDLQQEDGSGGTACDALCSGSSAALALLRPAARKASVECPSSAPLKRGLYEGTVRCGSPRNTWSYCLNVARTIELL